MPFELTYIVWFFSQSVWWSFSYLEPNLSICKVESPYEEKLILLCVYFECLDIFTWLRSGMTTLVKYFIVHLVTAWKRDLL